MWCDPTGARARASAGETIRLSPQYLKSPKDPKSLTPSDWRQAPRDRERRAPRKRETAQ